MKRGFTLIEMLIVVVVLGILMSITFRLSSIGENQTARSVTIQRLQRVENCLSGYMAAFGTYPPVPLHNRRNIYLEVEPDTGVQKVPESEKTDIFGWNPDTGLGSQQEQDAWLQVRAACEAQPIGCYFPYGDKYKSVVRTGSEETMSRARNNKFSRSLTKQEKDLLGQGYSAPGPGSFDDEIVDWREQQIFQFGVLSFLLPRYLVMLDTDSSSLDGLTKKAQWTANNSLPYDPFQGDQYEKWDEVYGKVLKERDSKDYAEIANIASQALCARWISNLKNICKCDLSRKFYGIELKDGDCPSPLLGDDPDVRIYKFDSGGGNYILDGITVVDGWGSQLYYYSPAPHQTYTLWSAGPNKRTFPPWVDRKELGTEANRCVGKWIEDDIARMSN